MDHEKERIIIENNEIRKVDKTKYLELIIDEKMKQTT